MTSTSTSNPQTTPAESLTFDGIAKHFNMPIADAANLLGVCSSVLKKICRDNGLVRWPYRKFLAGKSVEDIQKDAARERKREMIELARASRQKDAATTSSFAASTISQQQGNNLSQDGRLMNGHQQSNLYQDGWPNDLYSDPARKIPAYLDEFKQGFPSNGLSTVTMRWWGSRSSDGNEDENLEEESATEEVYKQQSHDNEEEVIEEKADTTSEKNDIRPQGTALLSYVRERAAAEGREALKLGIYGRHGSFKPDRREKLLLLKIFKSSLPNEPWSSFWMYGVDNKLVLSIVLNAARSCYSSRNVPLCATELRYLYTTKR